jgi:NET1-associated nuclear protein 1 (U3 small nucleolar RNA-associated protein 17)
LLAELTRTGNYLISGGAETVLVLWQLSTGKQQHLPHLTAAIENIVLSPTGASYAVTLANNSVLVLSTTELDAKMNVIGVQSRRVDMEQFPREARPSSYSSDLFTHVPMVVDPKSPGHVLFPAPSSQPRHEKAGFRPQPYLQTFDIAHQHTVGRQALTRNNATDPNMAPDGRRIEEPNVTLVQVSSDGKWLATVDEWIPPRDDIAYLDEGIAEFNEEERSFRREIYLKFWQWDEKSAQWALESRIDAPHFFEGQGASARILDLVADPAGAAFATVGEDRSVRIWRPKTRTRGGVTVRGADKGEGLVTWSLHRSISLNCSLDSLEPNHGDLASKVPQRARMAFSADGSVLAAGIADVAAGVIHIIDAIGGSIKRSITELDAALLSHLGILGRHMIVVGPSIIVWDLVTDELVHCIPYGSWDSDRFDGSPLVRLAVNAESGTFAVALPHFEADNSAKSRNPQRFLKAFSTVSVFDPHHSRAIFESRLPNYTLALVPAKNGKGYITLDSNSTIQVLSPDAGPLQLPTAPEQASELLPESHREDEPVDETETAGDAIGQHLADNDFLYSENDKPVVRPEDLQHVFDAGPSHALLPVKDLFNAVVGLYARKPRAGVVA